MCLHIAVTNQKYAILGKYNKLIYAARWNVIKLTNILRCQDHHQLDLSATLLLHINPFSLSCDCNL
jgi:hypothetical protein